ncbi:hypothetical protein CPB83DRAFT_877415 [Crepidotus variabilis]|uniref:G3BP-like protein n=1 Tax=Crepidotus variabilis TaxID=179855 RepID=A0A9P6E993_9AGAR|nr:hypothetical protein CPB83DRAFT_877415 [Crepidotus variabilis]
MASTTATPTTTAASQHSNVVPSEVGWQFVPQYYGFVNKEPHRLHCFYSKNSTFVHGTEGEESKPCYGQTEIHKKITSIGFDNCKVFIHSVDTQASANGGIIIQVIGEMSNHGDAWRKFVQTFFLAEQPNGYFVLNDIFRFLKEETVEGDDASSDSAEPAAEIPTIAPSAPATIPSVPEPVAPVAAAPPPPVEPEPVTEQPREPTPTPLAPAPVEPEPPAPIEEAPKAPEAPVPTVQEPKQTPTPAPEPAAPSLSPAHPNGHAAESDKPAAPPAEAPPKPAPSPKPSTPAPSAAPPAAPSQPAAPSAPRSWASLAATNQKKWGSVAQDSKAVSESVSMPTTGAPASVAAQTAAPSGPPAQARPPPQQQQQQRGDHPALIAAQSVNTPQVFVKGVIEPVSQTHLINTLTSRFGPVKDVEIVRQKACAFLEFTTLDAARRAIIASLSPGQGGEGGVRVEVGGGAQPVRITVETKKEKGDRPPSRPHRGGAPPQMNGGHNAPQGGFRGRGGPRGGRGGGGSGSAPQK